MSDVIRIAIVDDHPFFRDGVRRALRKVPHIEMIAEGGSAAEAETIARTVRPDIMVLDVTMPGGGIEAIRTVTAASPSTRVIMLTGSDDAEVVANALAAGASGYLLKGIDAPGLIEAVRSVHQGLPYITPALSSRLLMEGLRNPAPQKPRAEATPAPKLSAGEQEILDHAARGKTNEEIAAEMGLAVSTIKNYMSRIFFKLDVRNRVEAISVGLNKQS